MTPLVQRRLLLVALGFGFVSTIASAANLINNGSFETQTVPAGGFSNFGTGSTGITGWTVVGPEASIVSGTYVSAGLSFPAEDGAQWLDLTGDLSNRVEGVEQTIATVPGTTYDLSYFVGNQVGAPTVYGTTSTVAVLVNGNVIQTATNSNGSGTTQNWEQFQTSFLATSSSSVLEFLNEDPSTDNTNGLDNVVLTGSPGSTVPEPSTLWLLAVGMAGTSLVVFRKWRGSHQS
jgi:hypothetical protein